MEKEIPGMNIPDLVNQQWSPLLIFSAVFAEQGGV